MNLIEEQISDSLQPLYSRSKVQSSKKWCKINDYGFLVWRNCLIIINVIVIN